MLDKKGRRFPRGIEIMIDATEARKITKEYKQKIQALLMNDAMMEVESACQEIKRKAEAGEGKTRIPLPSDCKVKALVHKKLEDLGFAVTHPRESNYLMIQWD